MEITLSERNQRSQALLQLEKTTHEGLSLMQRKPSSTWPGLKQLSNMRRNMSRRIPPRPIIKLSKMPGILI